jgi:predicted NUDIX family NTP pyrophosphohydrolase
VREFEEETGHRLPGPFVALQPVRLKSGQADRRLGHRGRLGSLELPLEHPSSSPMPRAPVRRYAEVDRIEWFTFAAAAQKINAGQVPLLMETAGAPVARRSLASATSQSRNAFTWGRFSAQRRQTT